MRTRIAHNELKSAAQEVLDRILRIIKEVDLQPDSREIATTTFPTGEIVEISFTMPLKEYGKGYLAVRFSRPETSYIPLDIQYDLATGQISDRTTFDGGDHKSGGSLDFDVGSEGINHLQLAQTLKQLLDNPTRWYRIPRSERMLKSRLDRS